MSASRAAAALQSRYWNCHEASPFLWYYYECDDDGDTKCGRLSSQEEKMMQNEMQQLNMEISFVG
jgi:hypothetical protein